MARANKYTSINYNHIYDRNLTNNATPSTPTKQSSSSSNTYKNHLSSSGSHGRMLVLTRPAPKPVSSIVSQPLSPSPQISSTQQAQVQISDQARCEPESDHISLRPLGRAVAATCVSSPVRGPDREKEVGSPKPGKFVPPHLRKGFVGKEESPGPEDFRGKEASRRPTPLQQQQVHFESSGVYGVNGRPKTGGHDMMRRGGESDLGLMNRPRSSGNRPSSSG